MKKILIALLSAITIFSSSLTGIIAFAQDNPIIPLTNVPYLETISFSNAQIDGGFQKSKTAYTITLDNPNESPSLQSYYIQGEANVFVTYGYDGLNHQNAIIVTLAFENGSVIYTFNYSNVYEYKVTGNANLKNLSCEYAEVQPAINDTDTTYKLYIPSDLTLLEITPITVDINARCEALSMELNSTQEPEISFTVQASDGTTKKYIFKIQRVNKTMEEVKKEKNNPAFVSFVDGEMFYQKPVFKTYVLSAVFAVLAIIIIIRILRRIFANPYDSEEKSFYLK